MIDQMNKKIAVDTKFDKDCMTDNHICTDTCLSKANIDKSLATMSLGGTHNSESETKGNILQDATQKIPPDYPPFVSENRSDILESTLRNGDIHSINESKERSLELCEVIEEDIELIEIPDEDTEEGELILPDEITSNKKSSTFFSACNNNTYTRLRKLHIDIEIENGKRNTKEYTKTFKEINLNDRKDHHTQSSNKNNIRDPLKCAESIAQQVIRQNNHDDDIEIIELRNSPIWIESDNDSNHGGCNEGISIDNYLKQSIHKQIIKTATTTVSLSKNITVRRTTAKKSTARTQSSFKTSNVEKSGNNNTSTILKGSTINPNNVKDFIDLLDDSSDDDVIVVSMLQPQVEKRTLKKRQLLNTTLRKTKNFTQENSALPVNKPSPIAKKQKLNMRKPTPQSNFLNAVQLQPTISTSVIHNPPVFSTLISNKNNTIANAANAFHGNAIGTHLPSNSHNNHDAIEQQLVYVQWLKHFIQLFCNPQFLASHDCFVLLQRVLKYNDFMRIKTHRLNLEVHGQSGEQQLDWKLKADLTSILFKNDNELTLHGQRFCEFTCHHKEASSKAITLLTNANTGSIALKTGYVDHHVDDLNDNIKSKIMKNLNTKILQTSKRKHYNIINDDYDKDEYRPDILNQLPQQYNPNNVDIKLNHGECKPLLRSKRTKRLNENFSYNEDLLEIDLNLNTEENRNVENEEAKIQAEIYKEIQRKVEKKRLEAKLQRQKQVKSFENAFIQSFCKIEPYKTSTSTSSLTATGSYSSGNANETDATAKRIRLNANDALLFHDDYAATNDAEDLLQATWIENVDHNNASNIVPYDDDIKYNAKENYNRSWMGKYRCDRGNTIVVKKSIRNGHLKSKQCIKKNFSKQDSNLRSSNSHVETVEEWGDKSIFNNDFRINDLRNTTRQSELQFHSSDNNKEFPQNIDPKICYKNNCNKCVICNLNVQRIVNHYVNEHRGCEVYISRLNNTQLKQLQLQEVTGNLAVISLYKNGQYQYEARCIFCQRQCRFLMLYWYQHFSMHTGEYAYRCNGCQMRRPTRSLLTQFHPEPCKNSMIVQDYQYDTTKTIIEANICTLCNYIQLHRENIIKHLKNQHNIEIILSSHIKEVTLLHADTFSTINVECQKRSIPNKITSLNLNGEENDYSSEISKQDIDEQRNPHSYYMPPYLENITQVLPWDDAEDAHEDLSYMICGMLDVQIDD